MFKRRWRSTWAHEKAVQPGEGGTAGERFASLGNEAGGLTSTEYHDPARLSIPKFARVLRLIPPKPGGRAWSIEIRCPICGRKHVHGWRSGPDDDLRVMRSAHHAQYEICGFEPFEAAVWSGAAEVTP